MSARGHTKEFRGHTKEFRGQPDDLRFVTFQPGHLAALDVRPDIAAATPGLDNPALGAALARGYGLSAVAGFRTLCCGGVLEMWPGAGRAWLAPACQLRRRHWPAITRMALFLFDAAHQAGMRRIETVVREEFAAGHIWARLLGFESEGVMRRWGADGLDYRLYARLREPSAVSCQPPAEKEEVA